MNNVCKFIHIFLEDFANSRRPPLTANEVLRHPKFGQTTLDLVPQQRGKACVAKDRGGPIDIAYEVHGSGPRYLVFIMGLGTFKTAWQRQAQYFGHELGSQYSCLIFDNRGMGESDKPWARIPKSLDVELADMKARMFSQSWLEAPDEYGDFPTNGDRFAAMELKKRQDTEGFTRKGFICQAIAAGWHHKSPKQLQELADKVGRQRIQVVHGTLDNMITMPHGETLAKELGEEEGVTKIIVEGRGHVLHLEEQKLYQEVVQRMVEKTENLG
ncbi:MAG: hypothetical protein Q9213_003553 [Squamulea squamosa]